MNKIYRQLENYKKVLSFIETIAKQNNQGAINYTCGYAIANIQNFGKFGDITMAQQSSLMSLAYSTANEMIAEICDKKSVSKLESINAEEMHLQE